MDESDRWDWYFGQILGSCPDMGVGKAATKADLAMEQHRDRFKPTDEDDE